jgi:hypothetical protein
MTEDNLTFARRQANLCKVSAINQNTIFDALAAANITTVTAEFDGKGDSGGITCIGAVKGDQNVTLPAIKVVHRKAGLNTKVVQATEYSLEQAIEYLCYQFLEQKHEAWKNYHGAFGTFVFKVAERRIAFEFNHRYPGVLTYRYVF